ncbi:MAG TPA: DUF2975 domain-containing protein [Peptococcaceae bacterium]|nr:DUF2975 domain-containing protein [Peptococcaceae bacterium]
MKKETLFLKVVILLIGIPILALCLFGLPFVFKKAADAYWMIKPILIFMYFTAVPFFAALYQALKLLSYIDKNIAFSELSVKALKVIKYCAISISGLYAAIMPFVNLLAITDDAPGVVVIGLVIIFASIVIAAFAAVLEKLLRTAIDIKTENELTI